MSGSHRVELRKARSYPWKFAVRPCIICGGDFGTFKSSHKKTITCSDECAKEYYAVKPLERISLREGYRRRTGI